MQSPLIDMFLDTMDILDKGYYDIDGRRVPLKLSKAQMLHASVLLPDEVAALGRKADYPARHVPSPCRFTCVNMDSYSLARKRQQECGAFLAEEEVSKVLVLNLANPVNPGGGVRKGSRAQEEDLCRKSSLLLSLESSEGSAYYLYNRALNTYMGSDAIILTPDVEIIKDENGALLPDSVVVSVMTCAAPMITYGKEGMSDEEYEAMVYQRIVGMLRFAASRGYRHLVLGAFGCGAFANDARVVSALFRKAFDELDCGGLHTDDLFRQVDFAVLSRSADQYNYKCFHHCFCEG
ncbi:MAG: TIGR02452 family protein [Clostridia bacterium]|nr:TIGR02452 family protein [Clostridia bacterium]